MPASPLTTTSPALTRRPACAALIPRWMESEGKLLKTSCDRLTVPGYQMSRVACSRPREHVRRSRRHAHADVGVPPQAQSERVKRPEGQGRDVVPPGLSRT